MKQLDDYNETANLFKNYLIDTKKYPVGVISYNTYAYGDDMYPRVEVKDNNGILIQSFVIMTEGQHSGTPKFPFYRSYNQKNKYGNVVNPACFIAVNKDAEQDNWIIYDASDTRLMRNIPTLLDYDQALTRFCKRWESPGNEVLYKTLRMLSYICLSIMVMYLVAYIISINDRLFGIIVPLDANVLSLMAGVILLILPPIMPYIKSLTFKDTRVDFDKTPTKGRQGSRF